MRRWFALYSDILYMHFSEGFLRLPESARKAVSPQSAVMRLLRMAGYTVLRLFGNLFESVEQEQALKGKVWLYVVSQNNYDSLRFVAEGLPEAVFVAGQRKEIGAYNKVVQRLSMRRKLLFYYKFPPLLFQFLRHRKASTLRFFDLLYDAVGFYEVYLRKLRRYKPLAIVFANDHNADARAMLQAAKAAGIRTIYIQHASVSPIFPPLSFDLNLLEGQDALDKYQLCGPVQGEVQLVGMPKADAYIEKRRLSRVIETVGIGCNLLDELEEVEALLRKLSAAFPHMTFLLRPHPRDTRNVAALAAIAPNIRLSDSRKEAAFSYLQQLDVQVSGSSGIHLEAVLLNVWSIFYDFNPRQQLNDYYGFIGHGLVDIAETPDQLIQMLKSNLQSKPQVTGRAKYYNATVGTPQEGHSAEVCLRLLRAFIYG